MPLRSRTWDCRGKGEARKPDAMNGAVLAQLSPYVQLLSKDELQHSAPAGTSGQTFGQAWRENQIFFYGQTTTTTTSDFKISTLSLLFPISFILFQEAKLFVFNAYYVSMFVPRLSVGVPICTQGTQRRWRNLNDRMHLYPTKKSGGRKACQLHLVSTFPVACSHKSLNNCSHLRSVLTA